MEFNETVQTRRSIKSYTPDTPIADDALRGIFDDVVLSPSSFNLQHWTFVVIRDADRKAKLQEVAWGQKQVLDCSAAILVCGKLDAWADAPALYSHTPQSVQDSVVPMINKLYDGNEQLCRDEAIRSASLAAMSLMHAATSRGYATGPMIGFDQAKAAAFCDLPANIIPVMLVVLGTQQDTPRPHDPWRPLSEVVKLERFGGASL